MELKIALIGAGWMGKAHSMSYRTARLAFGGEPVAPVLEVVADANEEIAARAAAELGYRRHARDWREVVEDPSIDIVNITTPNDLHYDIAMAAIAAGKHIYCEKPLTNDAGTSFEMAAAAEKAGVTTMVGFNYIKNPVQNLARKLIEEGELGSVTYYRGMFNSDFLGRRDLPFSWRNDKARAGSGVISDVGAHCFAYFRHLVAQPIDEVMCDLRIVFAERPRAESAGSFSLDAGGAADMVTVDTDDVATAMFRFGDGAIGHMEMSRVSLGRRMEVGYDVTGTEGRAPLPVRSNQRASALSRGGTPGDQGVQAHRDGGDRPPLRRVFPRAGDRSRLQRLQGHGGPELSGSGRGRRAGLSGLPVGGGDPAAHRRVHPLGCRGALGEGRRGRPLTGTVRAASR